VTCIPYLFLEGKALSFVALIGDLHLTFGLHSFVFSQYYYYSIVKLILV